MSHNNRCKRAKDIDQPGPRAMHVKHCDVCTSANEAPSGDGNAILPDDLEAHEIAHATANMGEADFAATLEANDFKPKDEDTARTATAKALIDGKGGGKPLYREVFGTCAADECDYGANGFESDYCIRSDHGPANGADEPDESDDEPATREADESADESPDRETDRATYVKELIDVGVSPVKAEEAATARFD